MSNGIKITGNISSILTKNGYSKDKLTSLIQASEFIVERAYVKEAPVDKGTLRGEIKVEKTRDGYEVKTTASARGYVYPIALHEGTGSLAGARDYGYTSGRVRANDIAYGIGGIRPNKFAKRARDKAEQPVIKFVKKEMQKLIDKQVKI